MSGIAWAYAELFAINGHVGEIGNYE